MVHASYVNPSFRCNSTSVLLFCTSSVSQFLPSCGHHLLGIFGGTNLTNLNFKKAALATAIASLVVSTALVAPAKAGPVEQEIINNVIQNILQNIRDQIQNRRLVATPGRMQFTGEDSEFNNRDPFATNEAGNPFAALAYAKAPAMAVSAAPVWIYGVNAIGSGDKTTTFGSTTHTATGTGAFDVTKIGIFTATDALTFVATGSGSWSHIFGVPLAMDTTAVTGSGTLAYVNGGFSADFTGAASSTRVDWVALGLVAPPDSSSLSYTGNAQYKVDFPYSVWFEPTVGFTYTEAYTANFGTKIGDATEVHAGGRVGTEMKWMGFTVQPSLSGAAFKVVDQNGVGSGGVGAVAAVGGRDTGLGVRGSGKINVIWTQNFSSYLEGHGSSVSGTKGNSAIVGNFAATQTVGAMAGLRYTW